MRIRMVIAVAVLMILPACGGSSSEQPPEAATSPESSAAAEAAASKPVQFGSREALARAKDKMGFAPKSAPGTPPSAEAKAAADAVAALRKEIGEERFGRATRALSCESMTVRSSQDTRQAFMSRAERIRALAFDQVSMDRLLKACEEKRRTGV